MYQSLTRIAMLLLICACTQDKGDQPGNDYSDGDDVPMSEPAIAPATQKPVIDEAPEAIPADQKPDLDLSLPQQPLEQTDTTVLYNPEILPNLFIKKKKEKRFLFGGGLLRKEVDESENEDFMDSIDGAEISIETKVN
jgi:hypothetical protein